MAERWLSVEESRGKRNGTNRVDYFESDNSPGRSITEWNRGEKQTRSRHEELRIVELRRHLDSCIE
jgi:hypothetical protein